MNQKNKIFSILAILLIGGFSATSFISYYAAYDSLVFQIEETTLPLTSDNIYSEIQRDLLNPLFISSLMAQDTFVRDWTINGEVEKILIVKYLSEIQTEYNAVTSFFVSEKTKNYYHPSGLLKKVSKGDPQDNWYFHFREMNDQYEINVDTDTADPNTLNIFINYKVYDYSGNFIGVTGVGLAVNLVKEMIKTYQTRYGRRVYFINSEGFITLDSLDNTVSDNIKQKPGIGNIAEKILTSSVYKGTYDKPGQTVYLNSRFVPEFGWYLVVELTGDQAAINIQKTLLFNLIVSLIISLIILFLAYLTIGRYQKKLEQMASTDELTGAANRQVFDMICEQTLKSSRRRKEPLSAILFDLDKFKIINDEYGHQAGDHVLTSFADTVREEIRESDIFCRWGGDEFFLILSDCDIIQAKIIAEKIRKHLNNRSISYKEQKINLTTSMGVTEMSLRDDCESFFKRIDEALYEAKEKGRNRFAEK